MRPVITLLSILFSVKGLSGLASSTSTPPITVNPECPSLHRTATGLQKAITKYTHETTKCEVDSLCTGLMCNGTHHGKDFFMRMELHQCRNPVSLHLDLIYPKENIKIHNEFITGKTTIKTFPAHSSLDLHITLERHSNILKAKVGLYMCTPFTSTCTLVVQLLPEQNICLNMKSCEGYNTSGDHPCSASLPPTSSTSANPTGTVTPTGKTGSDNPTGTVMPTGSDNTTSTVMPTGSDNPTSTVMPTGSDNPTGTVTPTGKTGTYSKGPDNPTGTTGKTETTTRQPSGQILQRKGRGSHMSVGLAVGIGFACLAGVLVILGALFYFKRIKRFRLRAAYYNDISMNDPLYESFGPEIA